MIRQRSQRFVFFFGILCFVVVMNGIAGGKNAISYNKDGWEYLKKGDTYKAVFSFRNALKNNPRYFEALTGLGTAYNILEAYDQSMEMFAEALKMEPESSLVLEGMGHSLSGKGNYRESLECFNKAVELSGENIGAQFGIARLYSMMGKRVWAVRKLKSILAAHPYHYDSLLLLAQIKGKEKRLGEARALVEKAIGSKGESPEGYIILAEVLLDEYFVSDKNDYIIEAVNALQNALSIQPQSFGANRLMGYVLLIQKNYSNAVEYFEKAMKNTENASLIYNCGVAYDYAGDNESALKNFLQVLKIKPSDPVLKFRLEDFLVGHDYKIGHPTRVMLSREYADHAARLSKKNFPDEAVMFLRRSIMMNPMNKEAHELLLNYYKVLDYNDLFIGEIKEILKLSPEGNYRDKLQIEIMNRRNRLYHNEGYSSEPPPRNVPRILVLDFDPRGGLTAHFDAGSVAANSLTFALGQFGRMETIGIRKRMEIMALIKSNRDQIEESLEQIGEKIASGEIPPVDYIVFGDYNETGNAFSVACRVLDLKKGFVIGEYEFLRLGKDCLQEAVLAVARKIYHDIPFTGKILRIREDGIVVNLGLLDGISEGDKLLIYKYNTSVFSDKGLKKKIVFTVKESDTLICFAKPTSQAVLDDISTEDMVHPFKNHRARRIE